MSDMFTANIKSFDHVAQSFQAQQYKQLFKLPEKTHPRRDDRALRLEFVTCHLISYAVTLSCLDFVSYNFPHFFDLVLFPFEFFF